MSLTHGRYSEQGQADVLANCRRSCLLCEWTDDCAESKCGNESTGVTPYAHREGESELCPCDGHAILFSDRGQGRLQDLIEQSLENLHGPFASQQPFREALKPQRSSIAKSNRHFAH